MSVATLRSISEGATCLRLSVRSLPSQIGESRSGRTIVIIIFNPRVGKTIYMSFAALVRHFLGSANSERNNVVCCLERMTILRIPLTKFHDPPHRSKRRHAHPITAAATCVSSNCLANCAQGNAPKPFGERLVLCFVCDPRAGRRAPKLGATCPR
jgi:hypothetical protein